MAKISSRKFTPVAVFDEKTMSLKLNKKKFKKKFDDGAPITSFEIQRMGEKLYFVRRGRDRKGNCHMWAVRVRFTSEGQVIFMQGVSAQGCIGNHCSACRWKDPDHPEKGCMCAVQGNCEHFISYPTRADFGVFKVR